MPPAGPLPPHRPAGGRRTPPRPTGPAGRGAQRARREPGARRLQPLGLTQRDQRNRWGLAFLITLLVVVVGKLVVLQGVDGAAYAQAAENDRMRTYPIEAVRGEIVDRNGKVLAWSVDAKRVTADPTLVSDPTRTALALTTLLGIPVDELVEKLSREGRYVVLADEVSTDVTDQIRELPASTQAGLVFQDDPVRLYPAGAVGGQLVGFVGKEGDGLAGIEQTFEEHLAGVDGEERIEVDGVGNPIPSGIDDTQPATDGSTVQLTLDQDLQFVVQQTLDAACADEATATASAVVQDVQTGEVVAMASCPGYDPGSYNTTDRDLLGNPVVSEVYEPGSVMKAVTLAAAIEEGKATKDTVLNVDGHIRAGDVVVTDAHDHEPIDFTVTGILAKSSNVGSIMLAREIGDGTLEQYLQDFGFGSTTGIELPGESAGILEDAADWTASRAANVPIGQGVSVTTLQMASAYQTLANDGVRIAPRVVSSLIAQDGTVTEVPRPEGVRVVSESTADQLTYMLEAVVGPGGTAPLGEIDGFRVAGKTGTAQRANPETGGYAGGGYFTTFVGYAPADDPQYVVAVDLERPTSDAEGGQVAAPVFADVMRYALISGGVVPSGAPRPDFTLTVP
ncbi:peptidoglycan D,D-transpeptidase FtsI family protein [Modestobacter sp. VKM Ac-2984]|uniref:peptidoglycan D,D-transpeptidase FtsI family protein n=1 Tax=Modestobacter sp. VKM Ac-2984 TaxID=3004138 RepID=UPI0022AAFF2B|nr:penicillin-binding protein 2 [Modestobacter sp. VKM Ac-2984]MCZ2814722.1 penicillin-binding protein 2 [Modestobacter sp. VKM Ac-2984]